MGKMDAQDSRTVRELWACYASIYIVSYTGCTKKDHFSPKLKQGVRKTKNLYFGPKMKSLIAISAYFWPK